MSSPVGQLPVGSNRKTEMVMKNSQLHHLLWCLFLGLRCKLGVCEGEWTCQGVHSLVLCGRDSDMVAWILMLPFWESALVLCKGSLLNSLGQRCGPANQEGFRRVFGQNTPWLESKAFPEGLLPFLG